MIQIFNFKHIESNAYPFYPASLFQVPYLTLPYQPTTQFPNSTLHYYSIYTTPSRRNADLSVYHHARCRPGHLRGSDHRDHGGREASEFVPFPSSLRPSPDDDHQRTDPSFTQALVARNCVVAAGICAAACRVGDPGNYMSCYNECMTNSGC